MTTNQDDRALAALPAATALVCAVEDRDEATCHEILTAASVTDLQAIAVVLAALVPTDRGVATLLADEEAPEDEPVTDPTVIKDPSDWTPKQLEQAHHDWTRIRAANRRPPAWVALGETEYQHRRAAREQYLHDVNAQALASRAAESVAS